MPVNVIFYHGWGFDSSIWAGVVDLMDGWQVSYLDRGYFGVARAPSPTGKCIAVTHSFGTMLAMSQPPPDCAGIIAVNGFDRFVATENSPGVHPRILARMIQRFEREPEATVRNFRQRCGWDAPWPEFNADPLGKDLHRLACMDCGNDGPALGLPILSIQGGSDPILPQAMREQVFASAPCLERRTIQRGGHLLPRTEPEACARAIRDLCEVHA